MADWKDVMEARREATNALGDVSGLGGRIEDRSGNEDALATLLSAQAICLELRALGTVIDFVGRS